MSLIIKTRKASDRAKIYRWLQRHNAFPYIVDGKNYSKLSRKILRSKEHLDKQNNLHGGLGFAECDGNNFCIDYFELEKHQEVKEDFYNYIISNIENGISIYKQLPLEKNDVEFIFGKREINPDCEQCNIFKLFQLKKK